MSDKNADLLQELLQIACDSSAFYRAAADAVETPHLKGLFERMFDAKQILVRELSAHIAMRGKEPDLGGTFAGNVRQAYAEVLAALSQRPAATYTYAAQLEEVEDSLLKHFDQALVETDSMDVRGVLLTELPKLRKSHDVMALLKEALAA